MLGARFERRLPHRPGAILAWAACFAAAAWPVRAWSQLEDAREPAAPAPFVPLATDEEAWQRLPALAEGSPGPLPPWARALATSLPRTTAAMLELDFAQRTAESLDPLLRARLRWVCAHANRSTYSQECAALDLKRAGAEMPVLPAAPDATLPDNERRAIDFVRQLSLDASGVGDAQVARLIEEYKEETVVAMALLAAYSSFQDRLVLSLGLDGVAGPMPPLALRFRRKGPGALPEAPPRVKPDTVGLVPPPEVVDDPDWRDLDFDALRSSLERQSARPGRIRVPTWEELVPRLPKGAAARRPVRVRWTLLCTAYQPRLAAAWGECTRIFAEESRQDRVFEESLFWIITRSIHCFY